MNWTQKDLVDYYRKKGHSDPVIAALGPGGVLHPPKRNKYGVSSCEDRTIDGIVFASKREAHRYSELKILEKAGAIAELKLQPRYEVYKAFRLPTGKMQRKITYVADFQYLRDGKTIVEDVKGVQTPVFRMKLKLFTAMHPEVTLEIVK